MHIVCLGRINSDIAGDKVQKLILLSQAAFRQVTKILDKLISFGLIVKIIQIHDHFPAGFVEFMLKIQVAAEVCSFIIYGRISISHGIQKTVRIKVFAVVINSCVPSAAIQIEHQSVCCFWSSGVIQPQNTIQAFIV